MDNTRSKRLSPARNGAVYPTLAQARLERRLLLGGIGAAALAIGLSCTAGAPVTPEDRDASVDAEVVAPHLDAGVGLTDAGAADAEPLLGVDSTGGIVAPDAALDGPDAGIEGGDS